MSKFAYKTIGNEHPQGKPRVYFACHPDDLSAFLKDYALKFLRIQTCAIWYETEYDADYDREELEARLAEMQLIVMPVTTKLLKKPNRAMDVEFTIAQDKHTPVLPVMLESGLSDAFTKRFGNLQYIDPNDQDPTRRSFDEVLKTYIKAVIVGDETAEKVRAAFDAYIFLSYRKKDRAKAQKLMRLIHKSPLCQDIAVWYDEFLTPGEDFNDLIGMMMEKSDLFALTVTPGLVNETNYVMTTEYPAARRSGKPILPVEMEETDKEMLKEHYEGIPDCVDGDDEEALFSALQKVLQTTGVSENDTDPGHCFLIGLAYLNGIDVEVDYERAVRLIRAAAEAGIPEAMEQLAAMYETGKGVARDYHEGVLWRRKYVDYLRLGYEEKPDTVDLEKYVFGLWKLGAALYALRLLDEAKAVYGKMLDISAKKKAGERSRRWFAVSNSKLGDIAIAQGRLEEAERRYEKSLEICLALAEETGTIESRRDLAVSFERLGDIAELQGRLEEAKEKYEKGLEIQLALVDETGTVESRRDLSIYYNKLGDIAKAQGRLEEAKKNYEKSLKIRFVLAKEKRTVESLQDLAISYSKLGDIAKEQGRLEEADMSYLKSLEIRYTLSEETGTVESRRDLSMSFERLGDIAGARGILKEAEGHYEIALEISLALAEETGTIESRQDLAICYYKLGRIAEAQGRLEEARSYYEKRLEIRLALAEETGTVESRRDLANSYSNLGHIAEAKGRLEEAVEYYEKDLEISLALEVETGMVKILRDLTIGYTNLGHAAEMQGRLEEAREYYEKKLKISLALAEDTQSVEDLIFVQDNYYNLGVLLYEKIKDRKRADEMFQAALKIGGKRNDPALRENTEAIQKEYLKKYLPVDIPEPARRKGAYSGIREILINAAENNPFSPKVFCAPDIPEKLARRAAEAYSQQISWRDIIVLEEYPAFLRKSKTVIYTDTILDSNWFDNHFIIEHNRIIKQEKIGDTKIKFWFEPAGDLTADFGSARESVFYMVSEILEKTR